MAYQGPFYYFDQAIQTPFTDGVTGTVNAAMSAMQGPLTAVVVLWIIVTGILVMRGDVTVRTGITRIITISIVVGILMSTTLYDEYIVSFFTTGIPNYFASSFLGVTGTTPSASEFDTMWLQALTVFSDVDKTLNFFNVLYSVQLGILQIILIIPIAIVFLIFEVARIMTDVVVCIGPFVLVGYLFTATKGVADRFIGKLISLTLLTLLIDIVLSIIVQGYTTYIAETLAVVTTNTDKAVDIAVCDQMVVFFFIGSLVTCFLPGLAAFLGGGISVSPLAMAAAATQAGRLLPAR
jgi:type IV secretion system protein VirB6